MAMAAPALISMEPFDATKISLNLWLSLLEANFQFHGIKEDANKKAALLVSLGTAVYIVLGNVCAPELPHTKTYEDLITLLKHHYVVKPSYHRSLMDFQKRTKKQQESLQDLYEELKALANNCNFGAQFDCRVRDQLFMAVENEIFFPNLVAENFDLQLMTSRTVLEKILNLEMAFRGKKSTTHEIMVVQDQIRCKHCGYNHSSGNCKFKNYICNFCDKKGHLRKVCSEYLKKNSKALERIRPGNAGRGGNSTVVNAVEEGKPSEEAAGEESRLFLMKEKVCSVKSQVVNFVINGKLVPLELDTGAAMSTLSRDWADTLQLNVKPCGTSLSAYDNVPIKVYGKVSVKGSYNGKEIVQDFYVVESHHPNLCDKDLMEKMGIFLAGLNELSVVKKNKSAKDMLEKYSVDAGKPINNMVAKIHLNSGASPKFFKARTTPFHYKQLVESALERHVAEGILEQITHSEWAAPIVPVLKADRKSMKIPADFKELNNRIHCEKYPLPTIDELLSVVCKGTVFSKIDLKDAYLQIPVDEESQKMLVINTHKGLYKYKRLPFGLSSSPAIFQGFMSQLLVNIDGVVSFLDDIIVCGENEEEHDARLEKVLNLLQEHNVKINKGKTALKTSDIEYLGYHISGKGFTPSHKNVAAVVDAPAPTSVREVQSFVGMITYFFKFVKNFSTKLKPLYELLKKGARFKWTAREENAFRNIKQELLNSPLLTNFTGKLPLKLEVDASPIGVGCVLLQEVDGQEKVVYFASKKLSPAEQSYSQLDKEALALVYAVKKLRYFLLGRKFLARTDHKPLLGLFGRGKQIPVNANARIQRWALLLSQFEYDLEFRPGKGNVVADALSRLPVTEESNSSIPVEYVNLVESMSFEDITFQTIKNATNRDHKLNLLMKYVKYGGNDNLLLSEYAAVKADLGIHQDVLLYRNRVVVPVELRCKILEQLHVGHNGINAIKAKARSWVWWPKMDQDIAEVTKNCHICFENYQKPQAPVLSWPCGGKP
nr:uncharacterized protein K02A2.6-like [Procambarus clarkii]XP_045614304.1 uncharacterized protein K02A2.6-like [Procambarus clarkii]XP_045614305.1 uncharacterized protein K02A2.6-like [Procambarus clarkii]XP_045614306.1 uncharacterized protein K02A2.6-like [Procambarus clarkii]XP_045614307.1 uncharacterized protein K02A2.6-like [Procambarus clarkii]XP_045614308.1 uncharacterized protein K02A2.6-like [Procambarus clarkii]XP_045614309.1 uncharacterized protein K02A2.6-like [Procambarus clarki